MRKTLVVITLSIWASIASADGTYIGTSLAFSDAQLTMIQKQDGYYDYSEDWGISGQGISVFAGYQHSVNDTVFTALELNFLGSNAAGGVDNGANETSVEQKTSFGASVLLGRQLGEAAMFGRIGLQRTKYELSNSAASNTFDGTHNGLSLGLGLQLPLNDETKIQMGWSRTFYEEETYGTQSGVTLNFKPTASLFEFGITKEL